MMENIIAYLAVLIDQQFAVVRWAIGNFAMRSSGKSNVVITNLNVFCIHYLFYF